MKKIFIRSLVCVLFLAGTGLGIAYGVKKYRQANDPAKIEHREYLALKAKADSGDISAKIKFTLKHVYYDFDKVYTLNQLAESSEEAKVALGKFVEELHERSNKDDAEAQYALSYYYQRYAGESKENKQKTFEFLEKAADNGHARANSFLSSAYGSDNYPRDIVAPDPEKSFYYSQRALELGDTYAAITLAAKYILGEGTPKDTKKAAEALNLYYKDNKKPWYADNYQIANAMLALSGLVDESARPEAEDVLKQNYIAILNTEENLKNESERGITRYRPFQYDYKACAAIYILYADGAYLPENKEYADTIAKKFEDDPEFARAVIEYYENGIYIQALGKNIPISKENKSDEWRRKLVSTKDPVSEYNEKRAELFPKDTEYDSNFYGNYGPLDESKYKELLPYAIKAVDYKIKKDLDDSHRDMISTWTAFRLAAIAKDYRQAETEFKKIMDFRDYYKTDAYICAMAYVLCQETEFMKDDRGYIEQIFERVLKSKEAGYFYRYIAKIYTDHTLNFTPDKTKAEKYYRLAIQNGYNDAFKELLKMYEDNPQKCSEIIKEFGGGSDEKITPDEAYEIGKSYLIGKGVEKDLAKAVQFLEKGAASDDLKSYIALYYMYATKLLPDNDGKAAQWREKVLNFTPRGTRNEVLLDVFERSSGMDYHNSAEMFKLLEDAIEGPSDNRLVTVISWAHGRSKLKDKDDIVERAYIKAEKLGINWAAYQLAYYYGSPRSRSKLDVKKGIEYAEKYVKNADNLKDYKHLFEFLASLYFKEKDYGNAVKAAHKALDEPFAAAFLARAYSEGLGVEKDPAKAIMYADIAKSAPGRELHRIASAYRDEDSMLGKNPEKEREFYTLAHSKGEHTGLRHPMMILTGEGGPEDPESAIKIFEEMLQKNRKVANQIAMAYLVNPKIYNPQKAFEYALIADKNSGDTIYWYDIRLLGFMYLQGVGTHKDGKKALEFFKKYAEVKGMGQAMYHAFAAYCYDRGIGVEKDPVEAKRIKFYEARKYQNRYLAGDMFCHSVTEKYKEITELYKQLMPLDIDEAAYWYIFSNTQYGRECAAKLLEKHPELAKSGMERAEMDLIEDRILKGNIKPDAKLRIDLLDECPGKEIYAQRISLFKRAALMPNQQSAEKLKELGISMEYPMVEELEAATALGLSYCYGVGAERNEKKGIELLKSAAEAGSADACFALSNMLPLNERQAYLERAARLGSAEANYVMATSLLGLQTLQNRWVFDKRISAEDYDKAYALLEKAARLGAEAAYQELSNAFNILPANVNLSQAYYDNVRTDLRDKYFAPERMFKFAVERSEKIGSAYSSLNLGVFYLRGLGMEKDYEKAYVCFSKAARMGFSGANAYLSHMNAEGLGVKKDPKEAARLYEEMKKKASADEAAEIAMFYSSWTSGIPEDKEKAEYWQKRAMAQ